MTATRFLVRPQGRLAYDVHGEGPLVVCVPGMGDTRAEYRLLAPRLVAAGFEVVTVDLRGHGESDATFTDHSRTAAGGDLVALLDELGTDGAARAHLIGCSFGAGAAVWAAARAPGRIASLTLISPFVREVPTPAAKRVAQSAALRLLLRRPWGPRAWAWWYGKLYPDARPADLDDHRAALASNLSEPGRMEALRAMAFSSLAEVEESLSEIAAPVTVVMGTADPDYPDPAEEARWIVGQVPGEVVLIDGAGHYPHVERSDSTGEAIVDFLASATAEV